MTGSESADESNRGGPASVLLAKGVLPTDTDEERAAKMRLEIDESVTADGFAEVNVLFADLVGLTELSSRAGSR